MRIGFFTSIWGWGGSESYLLSLMRGVREAGHNPVLFGVKGSRLWREAGATGIACVACYSMGGEAGAWLMPAPGAMTAGVVAPTQLGRWTLLRGLLGRCLPTELKLLLGAWREVRLLQRIMRTCPIAVLHVNVSGYELAGCVGRHLGIPSVGMQLNFPVEDFSPMRRALRRWSCRAYDHVTSQSPACTRAWQMACDLPSGRTSYIWNGVDLERFRPVPRRPGAAGILHVVSVARLHPMKGFEYLVRAVAVTPPGIRLTIVGEGDEGPRLQRLVDDLGVADRVRFTGHVEDPERTIREADVFALVSVDRESGPAALSEAMACGVPAVTSDFGPMPDMNMDGITGLVVPRANVDALAAALIRMAERPDERVRMGTAARERAERLFSRAAMIKAHLDLYKRIMGMS